MTLLDEANQIKNEVQLPDGADSWRLERILDWVARAETSFLAACRAVGVMTQWVTKWKHRCRRSRAAW